MQDGCLLLVELYLNAFEGNRFCGQAVVLEWALSAIRFWADSLHRDGSGDEVYPFERSFCATAFSACAATEALLLIGKDAPEKMTATGKWLATRKTSDASNQLAAGALALYNIGLLRSDEDMIRASD